MKPSRAGLGVVAQFLFAFGCVFCGLVLPSPGLGPVYTRAHAALGNALVSGARFENGVELSFDAPDVALAQHPWQLTLRIHDPVRAEPALMPMDLRTLLFLPLAAFIALAVAVPLGSAAGNARVLAVGVVILVPGLWLLTALPVLSFLGGAGPVRAFRLWPALHVVFQTVYRALVAPPGMMYALPLLLWWVLIARLGSFGTGSPIFGIDSPKAGRSPGP